jgi:hypothetical protein
VFLILHLLSLMVIGNTHFLQLTSASLTFWKYLSKHACDDQISIYLRRRC